MRKKRVVPHVDLGHILNGLHQQQLIEAKARWSQNRSDLRRAEHCISAILRTSGIYMSQPAATKLAEALGALAFVRASVPKLMEEETTGE